MACNDARVSPVTVALLSGGVAGCVGKTVTAPLQRLVVLAQTSGAAGPATSGDGIRQTARNTSPVAGSIRQGIANIVQREGFLSLWKGNACTCLHRFPSAGLNFAVVEFCSTSKVFGTGSLSRFLSGAAAGCVAVVACYPLDLVRTRIMTQQKQSTQYSGIGDCLKSTLRREGCAGLYRGMGTTLALTAPALSVSFGVYGLMKDGFTAMGYHEKSPIATILSGGTAGSASATLTYPLDVVRRRLQVAGMFAKGNAAMQRSALQEARHIWRFEGVRGFFPGIASEVVRTFPMIATTFLAFELLRP